MPVAVENKELGIPGVFICNLEMLADSRGVFTEVFRTAWFDDLEPVQWNIVASNAGTFRGMHVHRKHFDYLVQIQGHAHFYLKDLRKDSPTFLKEIEVELSEEQLQGLKIPCGVAHAFYFPVPGKHIYAVTHYWDQKDELGVHYADPELGFKFQEKNFVVSERDEALGSLRDLLAELNK